MRGRRATALVLVSMLVWACGEGHGPHHAEDHEAPGHGATGEGPGLRLDDGQRWEMDGHTRSLFAKMAKRVEGKGHNIETAKKLGLALDADIDELIRGCTMTGDAHGELHKFLVVLMPAVEELASSGGEGKLAVVRDLLDSYPRFFE